MILTKNQYTTGLILIALSISLSFNFTENINILTFVILLGLSLIGYFGMKYVKYFIEKNKNLTNKEIELRNQKIINSSDSFIKFDQNINTYLKKIKN